MSDNRRRYRAIRAALIQGYPDQPTGTIAPARDDPRRAAQRHRREQKYTTAQNGRARARWDPAREPGQTLCEVAEA
jgi:hypothetical protein